MSTANTEKEVRRRGNEYGRELAAALVLASSRGNPDRAMKRQMAQIVLDQIEPAVEALKNGAFPERRIQIYERAVRSGVHEELLTSGVVTTHLRRAA